MRYLLFAALAVGLWRTPTDAAGPFELSSPDSSTVLRLQFVGQLQTVWENRDQGAGNEREAVLFMRARRIRPVLTVSVPDYKTVFRLHLSTAPGSVELMDLYFNTELTPQVQVRTGQYKIPFTHYRIQSFQRLTFVDWSLVTRFFGAERQIGVSLHNGYEKPPVLGYVFGVFSGVNARASHATGLASLFGEPLTNPSDLAGSAPKAEFHPELAGHFSWNGNGIEVRTDSDAEGGGFRCSAASSAAWDLDPTAYQDLALRVAQEFLIKYRHLSVMSAGYVGFTDVNGSWRTRKALVGLLVQGAWLVTKRCEFSLRYALVDIDDAVADAALMRAQTLVAEGGDEAIKSSYRDAGMLLSEQEGTLGFNVYLDNHDLKLQNDLGFTRRGRRDGNLTDYLIRSQLQLAF